MSIARLDALAGAQAVLATALDGDDPSAIEHATARFSQALFDVRAGGAWHVGPELARKAAGLLGEAELAQQRVKQLTRETRERLAAIDAVLGRAPLYDGRGLARR